MLALSGGTYAFRFAGPALRSRVSVPAWLQRLLEASAVVLLFALGLTTAVLAGHSFAGAARLTGVAVGAVLAWRRAPFLVVLLAAAATTALLRVFGIP
jgi:branched-subunit amino acid transport protein